MACPATAGGLWSIRTRSSLSAAAAAFIVTPSVVGFIAPHARSARSVLRRPAARFQVVLPDDDTLAAVFYLRDMTSTITSLALRVWPLIRRYGFDVLVLLGALESALE